MEFLTKVLIVNDLQPFFILLFHFSFSLTLSLTTSQHPNDPNTEPDHIRNIQMTIATISPSRRSRHSRRSHSRRSRCRNGPIHDDFAVATIVCRSPFATISLSQPSSTDPQSRRSRRHDHHLLIPFAVAVTFVCGRRLYCLRICLPSSLRLAVVAEA